MGSASPSALADAALRAAALTLAVEDAAGRGGVLRVAVTGVVSSQVSASVALRRGARVASLDVSVRLAWDATWRSVGGGTSGAGGAGTRLAAGEAAVQDVGGDELGEEFPVAVRLTHAPAQATGEVAVVVAAAKDLASGPLAELLRETLRALSVGAQRVVAAGDAPAVEASNWNASGWGWEDRDCTAWARARLREVLVGFDVDVPGAHIAVVDVEDLVGEASITLRKGRKLVLFDLSFVAKWEGTLLDPATGDALGSGDGEVVVTDLDQDCFTLAPPGEEGGGAAGRLEVPLLVRAAEDGGARDAALVALLKAHGVPLLRARLAAFAAELKAHE